MHLPKRSVAVIGSALMAVAVLSSAPASATSHTVRPAAQDCFNGDLCLYQNKNINLNGGSQWNRAYNDYAHDQWIYVGDGANDQVTSFINYRTFSSGIAKNKLDISRTTCARIIGDGNQQFAYYTEFDLSDNRWPDQTPMNDSISAFMLMSSDWNLDCGEVFAPPVQ